jgi:spermidine/putrescine transport system substrate-binding protein
MNIHRTTSGANYRLSGQPWRAGPVTRRSLLAGAAAGVAALTLPGGRAHAATRTLNWVGWDGYQAPEVVGSFMEANDVDIRFESLTDPGGTFTKLAAGAYRDYDLVVNDVPWIQRMGAADICTFLDPSEYEDVTTDFYDQFKLPFEPLTWDGKVTGLPTRWGWVGMNLNTKFSDPDDWTSYAPVFDAKNRNKIGILDFGDWATFQVILYAGINPFEELDSAALTEVRNVFRALFKNTRLITADLVQAQRAMLDGSALIFLAGGNYLASGLRKAGNMEIVSYVPEPINGLQQGVIWLEAAGISKGSREPELAKGLIKHLVSEEAGKALCWTEWSACPVPNKNVEASLTDEQRKVIQVDDMWTYYDRALTYSIAPNIDDILDIWQEELNNS